MSSTREAEIPAAPGRLIGDLETPVEPFGAVLFAHGSGSSRFSPRNRMVAQAMRERGLATLLVDLLTPEEDEEDRRTARLRFDISLLAERLVAAVDWLAREPRTAGLPVGASGPAPGRRRPWWPRPDDRRPSGRWSPGEGAPTWRGRSCRWSGCPPSWWSEGRTSPLSR